jgi:hypothetical protein
MAGNEHDSCVGAVLPSTAAGAGSPVRAIELPALAATRYCSEGRGSRATTASPQDLDGLLRRLLEAHASLRHGRDEVPDMDFLFRARVFEKGKRIDPRARLKGRITDNEFSIFVDSCLKANKSPGPDGYSNECVKTMSYEKLEILREWANEILAMGRARVMTVDEMNGTIRLLHKGGATDDRPQDWRPVV